MIDKSQCYNLGYFAKTRGFKGELSLFLDVDQPEDYTDLERILVDLNDVLTPFFIEKITIRNNGFADVYLEGISNRETATTLSGKQVFLPLSDLPELPEDQYYLHDLEGMTVVDKKGIEIGEVSSVLDYSNNPLIQIDRVEGEILIPIIPEFILKVDKKAERITVELPEGLIDINKG